MGEYTTMFKQEQSHVDIDSVVNIGLLCGTIEGNPHDKKTRTTITKICHISDFDAFYLDVRREVDEDLLNHITSFASLYMLHAFYDSLPGVDRAESVKAPSTRDLSRLPFGPYRKDFTEEHGQETSKKEGAKIIPFPIHPRKK